MSKNGKGNGWIGGLIFGGLAALSGGLLYCSLKGISDTNKIPDTLPKITEQSFATAAKDIGLTAAEPAGQTIREAAAAVSRHAPSTPFEVGKHPRNLPEGWTPSPEKIASALENGFELSERQTWVRTFTKGGN